MGKDLMLYIGAMALGALHSFEPGHGKTVIAAYMVGTRGRAVDGMLLGLIVTFTHTFSVVILGVIASVLATTFTEEQLHGWMGLLSSCLVLAVGCWMLKQRLKSSGGHVHLHLFEKSHDHNHEHHDGHHKSGRMHLFLLGISGGLVPCPAAIATLLAAIAAGRTAQGLTIALFFSLGLGLVMMTIGVLLSQAGKLTEKLDASSEFSRKMGIFSAVIITIIGLATLLHSIKILLT